MITLAETESVQDNKTKMCAFTTSIGFSQCDKARKRKFKTSRFKGRNRIIFFHRQHDHFHRKTQRMLKTKKQTKNSGSDC